MGMTDDQEHDFYQVLVLMSEYFADPMSGTRQRLYWEMLADHCTLPEWEWACRQAMEHETFHKVPLVSVMKQYVREQRTEALQQHKAERLDHSLPRGPEEALIEAREDLLLDAEVSAHLQSLFTHFEEHEARKAKAVIVTTVNPPDPSRWLPLTPDLREESPSRLPKTGVAGLTRLGLPQGEEE